MSIRSKFALALVALLLVGGAHADGIVNGGGAALTAGQIPGSATNDNASAGNVGEYIFSSVAFGSAVALTTNTAATVTTITLTAGDWDVWGNIVFSPASTTVVSAEAGTINTAASFPSPPNGGAYASQSFGSGFTGQSSAIPVGSMRLSLSATTTVFLIAQASFVTSANAAYGFLGARRRR